MDIIIGLAGGLALFIFGMQMMSTGLKNAAGEKMQSLLEKLTSKTVFGVLVGTVVTALIQSSSATTVMVVGFVNAGIMNIKQAVAVIMGANIGTTVTSQLISFKISQFVFPLIIIGFVLHFFGKRALMKYIGSVILGFGILLHGMGIMGVSLSPLRESPAFNSLMVSFSQQPWLGLLFGILITILLQSSTASTGILIALAGSGLIPLESGMPIIFGTNVGTCVTAVLSSIGTNRNAKRAALGHVIFNLMGSVLFMFFIGPYTSLIYLISGPAATVPRLIANAHTGFNVFNALLFVPLINVIVRMIYRIIPELEEEKELSKTPLYLDDRMLGTPEIASSLARKELVSIGNLARKNYRNAMNGLINQNPKKLRKVFEVEPIIDKLEKQTTIYLTKISQQNMRSHLSRQNTGLLHIAYDLERIGDHAENIAQIAQEYIAGPVKFSPAAQEELQELHQMIMVTLEKALLTLQTSDLVAAQDVRDLEKQINAMERTLRNQHTSRLKDGLCVPAAGVMFLDILSNMERVGDHCDNIAEAIQEAG